MDNFHSPPRYLGVSVPGHTEGLLLLFLSANRAKAAQLREESACEPLESLPKWKKKLRSCLEYSLWEAQPQVALGAPTCNQFCLKFGGMSLITLLIFNVNILHAYYYLCYFIIYWFDLFICSFVICCPPTPALPCWNLSPMWNKILPSPQNLPAFIHSLFPPNLRCPTVSLQI